MTHAVLHFWHWQHILWEWVVTLLKSGNLTLLKTEKLCGVWLKNNVSIKIWTDYPDKTMIYYNLLREKQEDKKLLMISF